MGFLLKICKDSMECDCVLYCVHSVLVCNEHTIYQNTAIKSNT